MSSGVRVTAGSPDVVRRSRAGAGGAVGSSGLFASSPDRPALDIATTALPPVLRPGADVAVMDVTKWFGETSGGVRTYLTEKARYVEAERGLRQVIVIPGERDAISATNGVRCYRLRGPRVPTQRPYRFLLATRSLRRIVEHEEPDLIEVGSPFLVPWVVRHAARRAGVPLISFYHSNFPRMCSAFPKRAGAVGRFAEALAWRYVRMLDGLFRTTIVSSEFAASELRAAGVERTERVPLGVDLTRFNPAVRVRGSATRRRLGLSDGPLVVYVGRFAREKELHLLIQSWPEVERRTGAQLALVGDGPAREALRSRAATARIVFLPYASDRSQIADVLGAADLYVSPSSVETFGLSALEALASGTPVLSSDRGGVAEQVVNSGAGALFARGNAASLADATVGLLRGDNGALTELGRRGRAYAEREHSWCTVFGRLFAVYDRVLGR